MRVRNSIAAAVVGAALLVGGCSTIIGPDGQAQSVVVGCEATSPAKSLACAAGTLRALVKQTNDQYEAGRIPLDKFLRLQADFEAAYSEIATAAELIRLGTGTPGDYLATADRILAAIEKELRK